MAGFGLSRIKVISLLILASLCCPFPAQADQSPPRTIRVVMDNNYPPYAFLDGSGVLQGILVDQWRLWERKTGLRAELSGMDWGDALRRMERGEFDVIDTIFKTAPRQLKFDFTPPYQQLEVPIFFDKNIAGITDAASLKGFPVAVKAGDAAVELLKGSGVTHLIEYPSYEAIIRAAAERKTSVFVVDKPPALYLLHKFGIAGEFRVSKPLAVGQFHRAVRKGNTAMLRSVEQGFSAISPAEYRAIEKRWYGSAITGTGFQARYLVYLIGAAGVAILLLLVSNRLLRRLVGRRTAELAASEKRYRALVDNIPLGITLIDRDNRILMVNRAQAELFGHPPEWFTGRLCYKEFEKREARCAHCPGSVSMETGAVAFSDAEGVKDDGSCFAVLIRTVPLMGDDGLPLGFIEVVEDVTERKRAEQTLENERSRLRTLLETIPDLVWLKDPEGVYLACNPRFERFFGAKEAEIVGRTDYDFVDRELADFFRAHDRKAIEAGGPSINEEWVTYADDGHAELLETVKTPMRDDHGGLIGVLGIARDITKMRQAEESLRESEMRYRDLVEVSPYAIYVHKHGCFVFANPAGCRLLGAVSPDDLLGTRILDRVHPEYRDLVAGRIGEAQASLQHAPPLEEVFVRLDGSSVAVEVVATALTYHGEPAMQVLACDITERKRLEEELVRGQKLESLGVLAGGIAHDFNNILTGILGNISFARMLVGDEHKAARRLGECEKAAKRAGELTQQLLTFARGGEPVRSAVGTRRLIDESLSFALRGANVKGVVDCPPDIWRLDADAGQMSQLFNNLLINAKQAMPQGGSVTVKAGNVEVHSGDPVTVEPGRYVRISVTDEGEGIAPEHLARIFDPYFTTKTQGSGLGLASVYSIIKRHGGMVSAASRPGEGSVFTLLVPAAKEDVNEDNVKEGPLSAVHGEGRILVMDDEELIRELLVSMLEELGYAVESCGEGSAAVALHAGALEKGEPFATIILDLTVPGGMGGVEAAALIRRRDPNVPLIVSSGYSGDSAISDYAKYGFSGFVMKPYTLEELAGELARCLGRRRSL